jgi:hypothetical protein
VSPSARLPELAGASLDHDLALINRRPRSGRVGGVHVREDRSCVAHLLLGLENPTKIAVPWSESKSSFIALDSTPGGGPSASSTRLTTASTCS